MADKFQKILRRYILGALLRLFGILSVVGVLVSVISLSWNGVEYTEVRRLVVRLVCFLAGLTVALLTIAILPRLTPKRAADFRGAGYHIEFITRSEVLAQQKERELAATLRKFITVRQGEYYVIWGD